MEASSIWHALPSQTAEVLAQLPTWKEKQKYIGSEGTPCINNWQGAT